MVDILNTAGSFIILIIISYFLKMKGIFTEQSKRFLSFVLINICLPCIIVNGFKDFDFDTSLLMAIVACIVISSFGIFFSYLVSRKKNRDGIVIQMMSSAGYNIGIFTIPFVSNFLSSTAVVCALMFDIGNAIFVFGALSAATSFVVDGDRSNPIPTIAKKLFTNIPFLVYIVMLTTILFNLKFPAVVYSFAELGANATSFLAMVMIGIMIEFKINLSEIKYILSALVLRYSVALASSVIIFFLPIFELELKKALMIAVFSPMSTACVVYAEKLKCKASIVGAVSSLSIIASIVFIISIVVFI